MKVSSRFVLSLVLGSAAGLASIWFSGCRSQHPDDLAAVYKILSQHELSSVEVAQDRRSGAITLKGIVGSQKSKQQAQQLTEQAAPGYKVQNQITVDATGIMGMATPNAQAPDVLELAHLPGNGGNSAPPPAGQHNRR